MTDFSRLISITSGPIRSDLELERLLEGNSAIGAVVSFQGYVRDINEGAAVTGLYLEHYPGMVEKELANILEEAWRRWQLEAVRVVHRVGDLKPSDLIVYVAVASQHRGDAFAACEYIMDFLKLRAPFWKKEQCEGGESRWLSSRASDAEQAEKWSPTS